MKINMKDILSVIMKLVQLKFFYFVIAVILLVIISNKFTEAQKERHEMKKETGTPLQKVSPRGDQWLVETKVDSLVRYAKTLEGVPYRFAGKSLQGFDCSGFTFFVFNKFDIEIPAGSANQYGLGAAIQEEEIEKGDLLFFRGPDQGDDQVGHVGIVISTSGEEIEFIHSSSGGGGRGVTINKLEHPHYRARFLGAKRMYSRG